MGMQLQPAPSEPSQPLSAAVAESVGCKSAGADSHLGSVEPPGAGLRRGSRATEQRQIPEDTFGHLDPATPESGTPKCFTSLSPFQIKQVSRLYAQTGVNITRTCAPQAQTSSETGRSMLPAPPSLR